VVRGARGRARLIMQVHDELVFEVRRGRDGRGAPKSAKCMAAAARMRCATSAAEVEIGTGRNWDEAH
jgi:DNA polymerase-1